MRQFFLLFCFITTGTIVSFSQLPQTDIWMMNITLSGGKMNVTKPVSISASSSYNDEPVFSPDGKLIFFTAHSDSLGHTEIYKFQTKTKTSALFVPSAESKHAPGIMQDGKNLSFISTDGGAHQRLWKAALNGGASEQILKEKDSIGSYCWMSADSIALRILTSPPVLQAASISTGGVKAVAQNVGSCIRRMPAPGPIPGKWDDIWVFTERSKENTSTLKSFIYGKKSKLVIMPLCPNCNLLEGSDNFSIIRAGIFAGNGSKIFILDSGASEGWTEVADLSKFGIKNIRYIVFSPDEKKLLVVSSK